jgi:O-acetyl-ADP-ribose deacetylase (regulator of RNase III)
MDELAIPPVRITLVLGDVTDQPDAGAIVNAANAELRPGGGVAGAIHRAAGPGLAREAVPLGPIAPGEAVITGGHRLPNRYVVHVLGPVYGVDRPEDRLLASCHRRALRLADEHGVQVIAFPAISTGAFGYPVAEAARVALSATVDAAPRLDHVREVRFVLWSDSDLNAFRAALEALADTPP